MTNLEKIIQDCTDADGLVNMDKIIIKYASQKTNYLLDIIYKHIRDNKIPFKIWDANGNDWEKGKRKKMMKFENISIGSLSKRKKS